MTVEGDIPRLGLTSEEFRQKGKEIIDFIADYYDNLNQVQPLSQVKPNFLYDLLPKEAPEEPESFDQVMADFNSKIMPGITHWQSGNFYGYYPANSTYPGILGEMLSAMATGVGFSWINMPSLTELETITLDWVGKLLGLEQGFLSFKPDGTAGEGGGVIQGTASEAIIVAMLAARNKKVQEYIEEHPNHTEEDLVLFKSKLVAYGSDQTHSSGEKASIVIECNFKGVKTDGSKRLTKESLSKAIEEDKAKGLIPFFVVATFGTTATAAIDDFPGIAEVAEKEELWYHVDGAYAAAALVCPEFRPVIDGYQTADSFNFNPHKWLLTNFDVSALYVKKPSYITSALTIHRDYYRNKATSSGLVRDYKDWQIPLGRRFRALKLWMVLRTFGARGLRNHIRRTVVCPVDFSLLIVQINKQTIADKLGATDIDSEHVHSVFVKANAALHARILEQNTVFITTCDLDGVTSIHIAIGAPLSDEDTMNVLLDTLVSNLELVPADPKVMSA
ncbi:Aromatic-L-amino-acid decarboxylase [Zancudomyces culisetae]|uniref:Aromatic-L-amino-acid decarboxylase n=1 Tax=Zancudomyces culisetae TaxID=1213189 RepID=A0A1R1PN75_ZANCU|nr:Aromatic-L-amino-acid decarboxylase [Zancudomyces culisetae]|eukprot:OMH82417.1 Aromatic-L-amino-acid decarboxylase [Zancudomyces culisetae]